MNINKSMEDNIFVDEGKLIHETDVWDKLSCIIEEFDVFHLQHHSPISLDAFDDMEQSLIGQYSSIFFIHISRGAVLIKWLLDETYVLFCRHGARRLEADEIRSHLGKMFGNDLSRAFYEQWFEGGESLTRRQFLKTAQSPLEEYLKVTGERTRYMSEPTPSTSPLSDCCDQPRQFESRSFRTLRLKSQIKAIDQRNGNARVRDLIRSFVSNSVLRTKLVGLFKDAELVSDIDTGLFAETDIQGLQLASRFIEWLSKDLKSFLYQELDSIFKMHSRDRQILCARANGMTLEEVGSACGEITRERVRQIEKKYTRKFVSYCSRVRPQYVLRAFSKNKGYVNTEDIDLVYRDLSCVVIYLFSSEKHEFREQLWIPELNGFVLDNNKWFETLRASVDRMPAKVDACEVENLINSVIAAESPISAEAVRRVILGSITRTGNVYSKGKLSKKDIYMAVLREHYPSGIKLFDDFEMLRFRNHVRDMFGEIELPDNNRAICASITDFAVLCDTGKYILPDSIRVDEELFGRIHNFILNNERNTLAFYEIFERFKHELEIKTDITNWHYLQGVLRYKYGSEFDFAKDAVSKSSAEQKNIRSQIEDYIIGAEAPITNDEIRNKFLGIAPYTLGMAIASNPNILTWGFAKYLHASKLIIDEETIKRIRSLVDEALSYGTVSTRALFPLAYEREREFMSKNKIEHHMALFSVLFYLFSNDYEFSRPFVAAKGTENINLDSMIREYLSQFDEINVSDLKTYLEDKQIRIMNFSELLENISDDFVRADEDLLVRITRLNLPDESYGAIEESLKGIIGVKGYLPAKSFEAFFFFPDIGLRWNPYLLVSLVKRYGQDVKVLKDTVDYRYLTEILVCSRLGVQDYDDLLRYALAYESNRSSFTSLTQIEEFLRAQELISSSIPKRLLDDGTISPGENRITIIQRR